MNRRGHKVSILISRLVLTSYCLMHGLEKFGVFGSATIHDFAAYLESMEVAMPNLAAYTLAGGLMLCGVTLAVGCFHKAACAFIVAYMIGSIWYVTKSHYFGARGFEYAAALIALSSLFYQHGPGPLAYVVQFEKQGGDPRGQR